MQKKKEAETILGDVIVTVVMQDETDDIKYPTCRVYRFDFEWNNANEASLIRRIMAHPKIVQSSVLGAANDGETLSEYLKRIQKLS